MQKTVLICLILALLVSPSMSMKKEKGAAVVVQTRDDRQLQGELITVKMDSLLLMDAETSADVSVNIEDVKFIRIVRPSKVAFGAGLGLLVGAAAGAGLGFLLGDDEPADIGSGEQEVRKASEKALLLGGLFGAIGAVGGGITGYDAGKDEVILLEGLPPEDKALALEQLRRHSRIEDFQ
jgi:hypothetical protein